MGNYIVGQRVRFWHEGHDAVGVIRYFNGGSYAIEVEQTEYNGFFGHTCGGYVMNGRGWWVGSRLILGVADDELDELVEISASDLDSLLNDNGGC